MNPAQEQLFKEDDPIRYGEKRYRSNLILPRYMQQKTIDYRLEDDQYKKAYEIILKWIDLEESGKLEKMKETALQGDFFNDIFGHALGYSVFSDNKDRWNLEPAFNVNGGTADGALGFFDKDEKRPQAVIELKGPTVNLDRHRFAGRTPVRQCWDYLYMLPGCPWGIVSNYVSIRLYHRDFTPHAYLLFVLNELKDKDKFRQFYFIFEKSGLLSIRDKKPRAQELLDLTSERQREVGDDLYNSYSNNRINLIQHLTKPPHNKDLEKAIYIAQKLIDRIIFIAFCEDRELLPESSISRAYEKTPPFSQATNPKWQNFLNLFKSIDKGNRKFDISPYNGGLFREDDEVDNLQLNDNWTDFFNNVSRYDFRDEVSVEVLGHLFEKSINDIERIRKGGLLDENIESDKPRMLKSAERKRHGIYYTPPEFTSFIVRKTVGEIIDSRFRGIEKKQKIKLDTAGDKPNKGAAKFWHACLDELKQIKIVDPACGSGAFLIAAYDLLEEKYKEVIDSIGFHEDKLPDKLIDQIPDFILSYNLYGVDLSPQAVEITQLSLWIRSAQRGKTLADLSKNIICGNSLVDDSEIHSKALKWKEVFSDIFSGKELGFDCVIGNPPWERLKLQEREFFDIVSPEIASAVNAATRRKLIEQLKKKNPNLHKKYEEAKKQAEITLNYIRHSDNYELTGTGDINSYAVFAELAFNIVSPEGMVGLLVPTGIATEYTTQKFFGRLVSSSVVNCLYDFENLRGIFQDVHRSYKFCILVFGGKNQNIPVTDFIFFAHKLDDIYNKDYHITLSPEDIKMLNPNTGTCPIFRVQRDAELTKAIYKRVPILIDKDRKEGGNPWEIKFLRMFDQTNDADFFKAPEKLTQLGYKIQGTLFKKGKKKYLPLYEAKMFRPYDHRFGTIYIKEDNWINQGQTYETNLVQHQNPEFVVLPRWWADEKEVNNKIGNIEIKALLCYRNITRATDTRTLLATFIPFAGVINSAPIILFEKNNNYRIQCCLLANLNSYILDFVTKRKIGNVNLNFFIVEQLPVLPPDHYEGKCPWDKKCSLEEWISERVLKLTCTSNDMIPLAEAAGFKPKVWKWKPDERAELMAQLDAAYFILYGIKRDNVEYILSTFSKTTEVEQDLFDGLSITNRILKYYNEYIS